ncbi:MAG: hypothetical protein JKY14_01005 [Paraglaciecola sp.]|nr:hypothetical protein [Paraglaciecola sp.]
MALTSIIQQAAAQTPKPLLGAYDLMPKLKKGGLVIVMRHQRGAILGRWDDFSRPWTECIAQRNLSAAGYAGAIETGQAFTILNVPIGEVLSSPMCRTMETARLVFDRVKTVEELGHATEVRSRTNETTAKDLMKIMDARVPQDNNDVIITHGGNIYHAYQQSISEGDMLFFERVSDKSILIGKASAADFDWIANAELIKQQQSPSEN